MAFRHPYPLAPGGSDIIREPYVSWPFDWFDQITNNGPLPVVLFLHGGDGFADDFMYTTFRIRDWWNGTFPTAAPVNVKAFGVSLQGVTTDDRGGDWNSGIMGKVPRILAVDDVDYVFAELQRLEQLLIDDYNTNHLPVGGPPLVPGDIFDRARLMLVGFSNGGQMCYRLVPVATANGWTVTAICVFATSIGGWHTNTAFVANPLSPDVDWTPTVIPSLLHIHGTADQQVNRSPDGTSPDHQFAVSSHVGASWPSYARADICGQQSAVRYATVANATAGWAALGAGTPPALPGGTLATTFDWDSAGGAVADRQVCFVAVNLLGHQVPAFGVSVVVEFLLTWGGL